MRLQSPLETNPISSLAHTSDSMGPSPWQQTDAKEGAGLEIHPWCVANFGTCSGSLRREPPDFSRALAKETRERVPIGNYRTHTHNKLPAEHGVRAFAGDNTRKADRPAFSVGLRC